jgi:hypothetical protein
MEPNTMTLDNFVSNNWTLDDARMMTGIARESGNMPRVHPNGFIQLDLDQQTKGWEKKKGHSGGNVRLHVWNPPGFELPHQKSDNEIHDHVFDMHSTVVRGRLVQRLYWFVVGGTEKSEYELYRAVYDKGSSSRLEPIGVRGIIRPWDSQLVVAGETYTQPAFTFHESAANGCVVTVMEKLTIHDGIPVAICSIGNPPDNDFDRATAAPTDYLWQAIEAALA